MPLDTILLVDTSGSMAGRGMRELKRACHIFLDGVVETAQQTGLKENVAIVEFNGSSRVVQSLTNDYGRCRNAVESLKAGGQTAMFDGMMSALKEILENGGILRICGLVMTPRIILMTDGQPTDSAGEEEAKKKVIGAAMGFGPVGWRECGLPHPVPIACVGCGACDIELLQAIAKLTNGMHVIVENISELSTFFRRQVLLIRFAAKFASDMERLRSQLALAAFLQEVGEAVEQAELESMRRLLLAMMCLAVEDDDSDDDDSPSQGATASARPTPRAITGSQFSAPIPQPSPPISWPSAPIPRPSPPSSSRTSGGLVMRQAIVVSTTSRPSGPPPLQSASRTVSPPSTRPTGSSSSSSSASSSRAIAPARSPSGSSSGGKQSEGSSCTIQ